MAKRRALGVIRLSKLTEETTSPARQRELIEQKAAARDAVIVGWAQDDDISASKYHPMKRPELKKWLDRPGEYDEIIYWRADRFVRKVRDMADMIDWSRKHGKGLVSATEAFDLEDPSGQGEAMAYLATLFAQMEARATSIRVTGAQAYLRESGRWQGHKFAYGYKPVPNPTGPGLVLVPDEHSAAIVREAVERVIKGESVQSVAADFNRRGIMAPQDYGRVVRGKALRCACKHEKRDHGDACMSCDCLGYQEHRLEWQRSSLARVLRNETLLGRVMHHRQAVLGNDGMPLVRTEPLIDLQTWDALQRALDGGRKTRRRTQTPSALLNVAYCDCGNVLYKWQKPNKQGRVFKYYRCKENYRRLDDPLRCNERPVPCDVLDAMVHRALLREVGNREVMREEIERGTGHEQELAAVAAQIRKLTDDRLAKRVTREYHDEMMPKLQAEYDRLDDLPQSPDVHRLVGTGTFFRDKWEHMGTVGRRLWLLETGVKVRARRGAWPSLATAAGPLTAGEIPKVIYEERGDIYTMIELGGMADLLRRVSE